ncbi:MAG: hypothetical protein E6G66_09190 [Actinobacteria bacterium]|nr:MAG: hypothetical protein E6G66_09190 [Actinomycetota bacterium]
MPAWPSWPAPATQQQQPPGERQRLTFPGVLRKPPHPRPGLPRVSRTSSQAAVRYSRPVTERSPVVGAKWSMPMCTREGLACQSSQKVENRIGTSRIISLQPGPPPHGAAGCAWCRGRRRSPSAPRPSR